MTECNMTEGHTVGCQFTVWGVDRLYPLAEIGRCRPSPTCVGGRPAVRGPSFQRGPLLSRPSDDSVWAAVGNLAKESLPEFSPHNL